MRYSKAVRLKEGTTITQKRTNDVFEVSYIESAINPDNGDKHCWIHVTKCDDVGCNIFHHKEII